MLSGHNRVPRSQMRPFRRDELRRHWDRIGSAYAREWEPPARARVGEREVEFILGGLRMSGGRTALDVGVGSGRIISELLRANDRTVVYGLDIAPRMLDATRARLGTEPRLRDLHVCDISREPVPFSDGFDFISAIRMLGYNENWPEIVAKLASRLSPGGVFVFSLPNARSLNRVSRPYAVPWVSTTDDELRALCGRLGLDVVELTGFTKLPHRLYSAVRSPWAAGMLLRIDAVLDRLVGPSTYTREFFVMARRT